MCGYSIFWKLRNEDDCDIEGGEKYLLYFNIIMQGSGLEFQDPAC